MLRRLPLLLVFAGLTTSLVLGCDQSPKSPTTPSTMPSPMSSGAGTPGAAVASPAAAGAHGHTVTILDACDPQTFDAVLGAGACTRNGGVHFDEFIGLLTAHQSVGAWHFTPTARWTSVGDVLQAVNRGGETHTFTEVEEFGGGIVPQLNELSGNTSVAPECAALPADARIAPGRLSEAEVETEEGVEKYQCCIHPWMRLELHVGHH